jgi:peptidoglycan/xylan/chitin deacetylase (PgdA/CDA1 family)/glycosyltransferase involved in cell wall biosynthesis
MNGIKLSVVIATFNRQHSLKRTLPALLAQDLNPEDFELIFVVDGSNDGTAELLRGQKPRCAMKVLELPHRGPAAARNTGIAAAVGDLVVFLDDDIICPPSHLRHHCAAHPTLDPIILHGPIYVAPESPKTLTRYNTEVWYEACYRPVDPAVGLHFPIATSSIINSSMPREIVLACGGFDERFSAQEDYELGLRLWKRGAQFHFLPSAVAYEYFVKPSQYFLQHDGEAYGRTEVWLCRKHPEHRPLSRLSALGNTKWWKSFPRQTVLQFPVSPAGLFRAPIWMCERLFRFGAMRKVGQRLLAHGRRIMELRGALKEVGSWKAFQREFAVRLPVLMYHHVGPSRPGTFPQWTISCRKFERQMRWLARRGYTGIRPADWITWLREGKGLPDKPVLLTFDDGYADLAEYALPVLRRYGFGAVVFVVTGQVGGTNAWDEAQGSGTHRLMTAEQIRYWATQGIEFGSHSRTHTDLTTLSSEELAKEIIGSRDELSSLLGSPVTSFAYPYGSFNPMVSNRVREAYGLTFRADETSPGINYLCTDPHDLQRTMIHPKSGLLGLECCIRCGHDPILELRERLRLRSRLRRFANVMLGRKPPAPPGEFS